MNSKQANLKGGRRTERPATALNEKWVLRLYVAGRTPEALSTLNNLKLICQEQLNGNYHIKVIDLLEQPQLARENQIFAIPTLIRSAPLPQKNIIGDLSDTERVLTGLDLTNQRALARSQNIQESL